MAAGNNTADRYRYLEPMAESRGFPVWEDLYQANRIEALPWYWPELDPDLEAALCHARHLLGRMLDLGTGPGTQPIALRPCAAMT